MTNQFNTGSQFINKKVKVKVDRPLGSKHPKYGDIYPLNYGFVPNTKTPDGEEIDAYILGTFKPLKTFTGICIAYIDREDDNEDKLIVVPKDTNYSDEQIKALTEFQERFFKSTVKRS